MRKITLFLTTCLMACFLMGGGIFLQAQTVYPYIPQQLNDFEGDAIATAELQLSLSDFTLEVQGTASQEINMANGYIKYTPETSGTVRFVQQKKVVYVFEGTAYKGSIVPDIAAIVFPNILGEADNAGNNTGIYNPANLLQNPGFETIPNNTWFCYAGDLSKITIETISGSGTSIRNNNVVVSKEGNNALLFHQPARFLTQSLAAGKIKPNHAYQVNFRYACNAVGQNQNGAVIRANLGLTERASDVAITGTKTVLNVTTTYNLDDVFFTGDNVDIDDPIWFSVERTSGYSVSPQKLEWYDRFFLIEGALEDGLTGATDISYLEGTAYAPEITLDEGDYYDMTGFIFNPNFDSNRDGWTTTTGAQNIGLASNKNEGDFTGTMPFWENWNGSAYTGKMYQLINDLPAGKYTLKMGVFANNGGTGLFVYAGTDETAVSDASTPKFFTVDFDFVGGNLEIGLNIKSGDNNWVGIDNVSLRYYGELEDPILSVSETNKTLNYNMQQFTFEVTGFNLTDDVTISAPEAITLSQTSLTQVEAEEGVEITATWNGSTDLSNSNITISSTDAESKSISVNAYAPKISNWDGRGVTGPSSKPTDIGWFNSDSAYDWWDVANGRGGVRLRDNVAPISDGRYLMLRGDYGAKNTTFFYPVYFDGGYNYTFSMDFFNGNGTNGQNILVRLFEVADTESTPIVTKQFTVGDQNVIMSDNLKFTIEEESSGVYYFAFTCPDSWQGITNLELTSVTTENTLLNFGNTIINTEYFTLQGVKVDRPVENGVYLMKRSYISGKTEVIKAFYKAQ